jgi:hypothetical protein
MPNLPEVSHLEDLLVLGCVRRACVAAIDTSCCKYIDTLSTLDPHSSPNTPNTMYS